MAYVDSSLTLDDSNTGSTTISFTVSSNSNRLLLVAIAQDRNATDVSVTGVTYNSVAMTQVEQGSTDFAIRSSVWKLIAPDSGTHDVVITYSGTITQDRRIIVAEYDNVDQVTGLRTQTTENDPTNNVTTITLTYTNGQSGDIIVDFIFVRNSATATGTPTQTLREHDGTTTAQIGMSEAAGSSSVVMEWAITGNNGANRQTVVGIIPFSALTTLNPAGIESVTETGAATLDLIVDIELGSALEAVAEIGGFTLGSGGDGTEENWPMGMKQGSSIFVH